MLEKINAILKEIEAFSSTNSSEIEEFKIKLLSRKGVISLLFDEFKQIAPDQKREIGKLLNDLKNNAERKIQELMKISENIDATETTNDLTLPGDALPLGSRHPISLVRNEINRIFMRIGFSVSEGPEIEDDWHVFGALNFAPNHPARDMQDTFFVDEKNDIILRTHTSSVQVRVMKSQKPPIRTISPGRVFRNEAISARSHIIFHQVEGLYIDKSVSFADLKQVLDYFAKEMFGGETRIRLRPSYFPFTEPSGEMDISCSFCKGKGCNLCKYTGWLEILGCGMVHPNVLSNCGIDNSKYSGFAFGMGIERIAMLRFGIVDIRLFFENDIRFLKQFSSII